AVIVNPEGTIGRMYGAATTPHLFIIDPQGRLIYQGAIDSIAGTDPGEIAQADNYVKKALDASLKGDPIEVSATKSYGCSVKY
ncbi:MAG TPA: thioredoxin family protein, partial [Candidatus Omnitrophota bacterium]|nr:thioredoxin family protein [Candidatus Omnitrophota bacterium]